MPRPQASSRPREDRRSSQRGPRRAPTRKATLRKLEAELAQDMYDLSLTGDAWEARRGLYVELYFWSKVTATPTFIEPPPSCGEDRYDIFRDEDAPALASDWEFLHSLGVWAYPPFWAPRLRALARSARGLNCAVALGEVDYVVAPDVEQAIRSKTMRLRPEHNTTPGRVEKYQSRGFTLLE